MKKINIKNYTSTVPATTSINKIEKLLVGAGARNIMKRYDDEGLTEGIAFILPMNGKQLTFDLKANMVAVYDRLYAEYIRPTEKTKDMPGLSLIKCIMCENGYYNAMNIDPIDFHGYLETKENLEQVLEEIDIELLLRPEFADKLLDLRSNISSRLEIQQHLKHINTPSVRS